MKLLYVFTFLVAVTSAAKPNNATNLLCLVTSTTLENGSDMSNTCVNKLKNQVQKEVEASITYLAMGAYFAQDVVNRPGFSKFFFDSASEEREHSIKIIEYLLMRGELTQGVSELLKFPLKPQRESWDNGLHALSASLKLENSVTKSIHTIIKTCESEKSHFNDYHAVDYLTVDFLDEQYKGQRDLAGKMSTLKKMMAVHGQLGEFLFDKKLLYGEI